MDQNGLPCKTCTAFKSWTKAQAIKQQDNKEENKVDVNSDCPLDKDSLGSAYTLPVLCAVTLFRCSPGTGSWGLLHTMAARYPQNPTSEQQCNMNQFLHLFAKFYPCRPCAEDFQADIKELPPETESAEKLSQWLCQMHNRVNVKIGKDVFDCKRVFERWRDGWKDGSCG